MARKLILMVALVSAVGFGFGWITEDLCCLGGSYADDPNTPVVAAEFALPSHLQAVPKAVLPTTGLAPAAEDMVRVGSSSQAPEVYPAAFSSLQNPRRC